MCTKSRKNIRNKQLFLFYFQTVRENYMYSQVAVVIPNSQQISIFELISYKASSHESTVL